MPDTKIKTKLPEIIPTEIGGKFTVEGETLIRDVVEDPKERLQLEIGDSKQTDFKPQAKIMKWDNEVNFSIRSAEYDGATVEIEGEVIKYKTDDVETHIYELGEVKNEETVSPTVLRFVKDRMAHTRIAAFSEMHRFVKPEEVLLFSQDYKDAIALFAGKSAVSNFAITAEIENYNVIRLFKNDFDLIGGLTVGKGVILQSLIYPRGGQERYESAVANAVVETCAQYGIEVLKDESTTDLFILVDGKKKKFFGISYLNSFNGSSSSAWFVNVEKTPLEHYSIYNVSPERLDYFGGLRELQDIDVSQFEESLAERIAQNIGLTFSAGAFTKEEETILDGVETVHVSREWTLDAVRNDIEDSELLEPAESSKGGLEIEVIFNKKPTSNIVDFSIETKGLVFYYQPELTQKEIDDGCFRPENVVGSYAVYHEEKSGASSKEHAKDYKNGKFLHIYRPKIKDADNREVWGELNLDIENGILQVVVPQDFLDEAQYPVVIDPTLGFTSQGGSSQTSIGSNRLLGSKFTASENGDITSGSAILTLVGTKARIKIVVSNSSKNIVTNGTSPQSGTGSNGNQTLTCTYSSSPQITNGNEFYIMVVSSDISWTLYYDSGTTGQGLNDTTNSFATPTNPSDGTDEDRKYSVYVTYTSTGGGGTDYEEEYAEVVTIVDTILKGSSRVLTDVATIVDNVEKQTARTFADAITIVDTVLKQCSRTLTDIVTIVDTLLKQGSKTLTDVVTLVDSIIREPSRMLTETVTAVDSVLKQCARTLSDVVTMVDTFTGAKVAIAVFEETITIVDTIIRQVSRTFTDVVTLVDTVLKSTSRTLSEAVALVDTLLKQGMKMLTETVTLVDTVLKQGSRTLTETVTVVDSILRSIGKVLTDVVTPVDTITRSFTRTFDEVVTLVDTVLKQAGRTLTESISLEDVFAYIHQQGSVIVGKTAIFLTSIIEKVTLFTRKESHQLESEQKDKTMLE